LKKTEKTLSIPKSKKIKIFSIAALSKAHFSFRLATLPTHELTIGFIPIDRTVS
jgi:hypothetical protein